MMTVHDVMTDPVVVVNPETSLKDVARLLVRHGISGLPVVDSDDRVLGVVSEADLLIKEGGPDALPHRRGERVLGESRATRQGQAKLDATIARQAMTSPAVTIGSDASLPAAAALMIERQVNRLPVVDADGRLLGVVSRADLVRAYVRTDAQITEAIRQDLLLERLMLNPTVFDVKVREGVVSISGQAETRSLAAMIDRLVAMVPGVIAVRSNLTWALDDRSVESLGHDYVFPISR